MCSGSSSAAQVDRRVHQGQAEAVECSQKATHAERIPRDLEQRLEMVEKRLHNVVFNAKAELEEGSRPRSLT